MVSNTYIEGVIARCDAKLADLRMKNESAQTADEVRAIGKEIAEVQEERAAAVAEQAKGAEVRMDPVATYSIGKVERAEDVDPYGSMEYRTAFKQYVQTGKANFPAVESRADAVTTTADIGKVIPTTILNEFIRAASEKHGQVYAKVRKLSVQGGVEIPIADLTATAKWVAEGAGSDKQKVGTISTSVSFKYHVLELKIAQSLVASIVSLDMFEQEIVKYMIEAFAKAMDTAILTGTGTGQPLGITVDPRVTNVVEMTEADFSNWTKWRANLFAKIPLAKREGGEFLFTPATWETYIMSMKDNNDRPLAKDALDSEDGAYAGKFFGRDVTFVEPVAIKDFATAGAGDVVGIYWVPEDYIVNTNLQLAYKRYTDEDTNQVINKGIVITDGKIADATGCFIIKKKSSS